MRKGSGVKGQRSKVKGQRSKVKGQRLCPMATSILLAVEYRPTLSLSGLFPVIFGHFAAQLGCDIVPRLSHVRC